MRFLTYILSVTLILGVTALEGKSQIILNEYARIDSVMNLDGTDVDSVVVSDGSIFEPLDTVLFIQMKGAEVLTEGLPGFIQNINNTGIYSIQLVDRVIEDTVILATSLREDLFPQKPGEIAQLIKIPGAEIFNLSGKYTCKAWDPVSGTGGVFALLASKKINLNNALIDVTGKGLLGGDPGLDNYEGDCIPDSTPFFTVSAEDSSGIRGESIAFGDFPFLRGYWYAANGGGGGNGSFSGGGGGSSIGWGGYGGKEADYCSPVVNYGGRSGDQLEKGNLSQGRIFMGGGGGTSTQILPDKRATKGGNGGGIIILITDTIASKGNDTIRANGQSVTDLATAGGGGGGGAGFILVDVENYIDSLHIEAKGGDGGRTNDPDTITGPGGFGGGGLIWHKEDDLPLNVTTNILSGQPGKHIQTGNAWGASAFSSSVRGDLEGNLNVYIRGFLFNVMPYDQDVCQFIQPDTIWASIPKGGDGTFSYRWQQSADKLTWIDAAPEANDELIFIPLARTDTTFYRRIVTSGDTKDTSLIHAVNVLPALTNNAISDDDTICEGASPVPLYHNAGTIGGGDLVNYLYKWEESADSLTWTPAAGDSIKLEYAPQGLLDTTFYRRVVNSHVCTDTSNVLRITVLDSLKGNTLYRDTSICQFTAPNTIISDDVSGGQPGDHRFKWQSSSNNLDWTDLPVFTHEYYPGVLSDSVYYRRIVYSGSDDACIDTSNTVAIIVHEIITGNNIIVSISNTICQAKPANAIVQASGSFGGGNGIPVYTWQVRNWLGADWTDAGGNNSERDYEPGAMNDSSYFRRIISSGACLDTSSEVVINVHPMILDNIISEDQVICDFDKPAKLEDVEPAISGGIGGYTYLWLSSTPDSLSWSSTDSTGLEFHPPRLSSTNYYKRIVNSGSCHDSSNLVRISVQDSIKNNDILNGVVDSTCYAVSILLSGRESSSMTGGDESYYGYKWIKSADNSGWTVAPEENELQNYTTVNLSDSAYYRRIVTSGSCTDTTLSTLIRINPRPTGHIIDSAYRNACYTLGGNPINYNILVEFTGRAPYSFVFDDGARTTTVDNFNYPAPRTFPVTRMTDDSANYTITLLSITDDNSCEALGSGMTGTASASIYKVPQTNISSGSVTACDSVVSLSAVKDVGLGTWSVSEGDDNMVFSQPHGASTMASTVFTDTDSLYYKVYWTEVNWECISTDSVDIVFYLQPEPAIAGEDSTVYFADTIRLFAADPTAGVGVWTVEAGEASLYSLNDPHTKADLGGNDLDLAKEYAFRWTITNGTCEVVDDDVAISRRDMRRYDGFSPDGNDVNDYYVILGLDYADSWEISFYSRHGNLIRTVTSVQGVSQDMLWDGKLEDGSGVEDGTYYYVLVVKKNNRKYEYKGTLELARIRQ